MPLSYTQNFQALEIYAYIAECTLWFLDMSEQWVKTGAVGDISCTDLPEFFKDDKDLNTQCKTLQDATHAGDFIAVKKAFETYLKTLHVLQDKAIAENVEYDLTTGLKNKHTLIQDLKQEADKLARRGQSFSLAVMRIDGLESFKQSASEKQIEVLLKDVSALIKQGLRSFDDAYFIDEQHFVLSLQQTSFMGGLKGVERVRDAVKDSIEAQSVSACVAEAQSEEDLSQLLQQLIGELKKHESAQSYVFSHKELSPIQRFAEDQE